MAIVYLTLRAPYAARAQDGEGDEGGYDGTERAGGDYAVDSAFLGGDVDPGAFGASSLTPNELTQLRDALEAAQAEGTATLDPARLPGPLQGSGVSDNPALLPSDVLEALQNQHPEAAEAIQAATERAAGAALPAGAAPAALPSGEAKSAVEPSRISLPSAEGSVEGMGESFAPVLSSGTGTFSVPISVAAGRAEVQPSLALSYASSGGNGVLGFGWSFSVPTIVRQSDRGLPRYDDAAQWTPQEDRFFYNGGQELVPVDTAAMAEVDASGYTSSHPHYPTTELPPELASWQQYRARVEGGFMRFFRSPDSRRWVAQGKDGTRFDFGLLPAGEGPADLDDRLSLQTEDDSGTGPVYAWRLTRMSDRFGSTVYYRYVASDGDRLLRDVHYLSPDSCSVATGPNGPSRAQADATRACSAPLSDYGARVSLAYESRPDVFSTYTSGWRIGQAVRLTRITVTAAGHTPGAASADDVGTRYLLRRYHLRYLPQAASFHSLLSQVQVEGRPDAEASSGQWVHRRFENVPESSLNLESPHATPIGEMLPPMTFGYTGGPGQDLSAEAFSSGGSSGGAIPAPGTIPGFGTVSGTTREVFDSPNVSVDEARADLFDVNTDGLPDLVVTDPARYRTADGDPAVGVFFNGFTGSDAIPAGEAGVFSDAIPVPMPWGLSGSLNLANANLVPMDVDGDGRSDFLHLPRRDRYGWFTPVRMSDEVAGYDPSPAAQGWRFAYAQVDLARGDDPRVDLVRDGSRYKMMDVDGDHLIDIIRTTGTVMQTWRNLGQYLGGVDEAGTGHFGSAIPDPSIHPGEPGGGYALSPEPYETCLLRDGSGRPIDFADPEVRLADMNGDGLQDIVQVRRGHLVYWPARGLVGATEATGTHGDVQSGAPVFGEGPRDCRRGAAGPEGGSDRFLRMTDAPAELNPDLSGVFLSDVNGDGAADVLQVRFREVDVWFNQAGEGFTARSTIDSPMAPDFAPRIRFADIDGSGTTDLVYGNAGRWQYLDLLSQDGDRGQRPRLLRTVDNGLGARTTMTYGTSAEDMTADLSALSTCTDCTPGSLDWHDWSHVRVGSGTTPEGAEGDAMHGCDAILSTTDVRTPAAEEEGECVFRSGGSPVVSTVVRSVSTTDNFDAFGRVANISETRFRYHDGYYEGIEQEFRGFGAADAIAVGDIYHPTSITTTHFRQGRRPSTIAGDRLAENPYEALKGRQWLSEVRDETGVYLSSSAASMVVRTLMTGLDGRDITYAYVGETNELRYDTAGFVPGAIDIEVPALARQSPDGFANQMAASQETLETVHIPVRGAGAVRLRGQTLEVDNLGHVRRTRASGQVGLTDAHKIDVHIEQFLVPRLLPGGQWLWVDTKSWLQSESPSRMNETWRYYTATGALVRTMARAWRRDAPLYDFSGDDVPGVGGSAGLGDAEDLGTIPDYEDNNTSFVLDGWGNVEASCAGSAAIANPATCARFASVQYDPSYAQLPVSEYSALHTSTSESYCDSSYTGHGSGTFCMVGSQATWDRGLGALLSATGPNGETNQVRYDGLGRMTAMMPQMVPGYPYDGCIAQPTQTMQYDLVPGGAPASTVRSRSFYACTSYFSESVSVVDGLGRPRAGTSFRWGAQWTPSAGSTFSRRGTPARAYNMPNTWLTGEPTLHEMVQLPETVHVTTFHDAFGRVVRVRERDDSETAVEYGALETRAYDAVDTGQAGSSPTMGPASDYYNTPSIGRTDGHGRAIDQVQMHRLPGDPSNTRYYRLFTTYRGDGAVLSVRRAETATSAPTDTTAVSGAGGGTSELIRTFTYDSAGRRLGTTDPDSDSHGEGGVTRDATASGWRYLYSRIGDLIGVRDSRGCGANYYYDHAGRLVAEDYVECAETMHHGGPTPYQGPADEGSEPLPPWAYARHGTAPSAGVRPDVLHHFDEVPYFATTWGAPASAHLIGRLAGSEDRGHRAAVAYDLKGRPVWAGRQLALLPGLSPAADTLSMDAPTHADGNAPAGSPSSLPTTRLYDEAHTYVTTSTYDRLDRVSHLTLPEDPDWALFGGSGSTPEVRAVAHYMPRGFMSAVRLYIDEGATTQRYIPMRHQYNPRGLVAGSSYGSSGTETGHPVADLYRNYDERDRPTHWRLYRRAHVRHGTAPDMSALGFVFYDRLYWDAANNLLEVRDFASPHTAFVSTQTPRRQLITHDSLYRVAQVNYLYHTAGGWTNSGANTATDPRGEMAHHQLADPMRRRPAPMVPSLPSERPNTISYQYDWLGNQTAWHDDAYAFYERSLGTGDSTRRDLLNGADINDGAGATNSPAPGSGASGSRRPAALYFASNVQRIAPAVDPSIDRGGWVQLEYGESGNVLSMTVRGQCHDVSASSTVLCEDPASSGNTNEDARVNALLAGCACDVEQHYQYRWDALNRLDEARRYDRGQTHSNWELQVRQQYRYDGSNVRLVKRSQDEFSHGAGLHGTDGLERVALYVIPGDFERRGLTTGALSYDASTTLGTETQYLIAGTRLTWKNNAAGITPFNREARLTAAVPDLLGSTSAVMDLMNGEVLERGTFLPSGVRETHHTNRGLGTFSLEPVGFTGKEADGEVGLAYFGHRYLMPHLGRWASADPLQVHAGGGGEFGNSYHYVAGNLLQARDPNGLWADEELILRAGESLVDEASENAADMTEDSIEVVTDQMAPLIIERVRQAAAQLSQERSAQEQEGSQEPDGLEQSEQPESDQEGQGGRNAIEHTQSFSFEIRGGKAGTVRVNVSVGFSIDADGRPFELSGRVRFEGETPRFPVGSPAGVSGILYGEGELQGDFEEGDLAAFSLHFNVGLGVRAEGSLPLDLARVGVEASVRAEGGYLWDEGGSGFFAVAGGQFRAYGSVGANVPGTRRRGSDGELRPGSDSRIDAVGWEYNFEKDFGSWGTIPVPSDE